MIETHDPNSHAPIWKEINDMKREVHEIREDVAYIRGLLEGKQVRQENSFNWKGAITNAVSVCIAAISLIISIFIGTKP